MFSNDKEIKQLRNDVQDVVDKIDALTEKQNSQFTEIMLKLVELDKTMKEKGSSYDLSGEEEVGDDMYESAREVVISGGKASTAILQRKLSIGYARAARLIDTLEENGVIGPGEGSTPRKVMDTVSKDTEKK